MATHTYTRTSNSTGFADPYKQCLKCGGWVTGVLDSPGPPIVLPCNHEGTYRDLCPSWGPVDGCQCLEQFGSVNHPVPPADILGSRTA